MGKENIRELSKCTTCTARFTQTATGRTFPDLFEAITAGSLQRIADSLETIADKSALVSKIKAQQQTIEEKQKEIQKLKRNEKEFGTYELQNQVNKLSARLKKAGLDHRINSDNRGKPKNGET